MDAASGRLIRPAGALAVAVGYGAGLATGLARFPDPVSVAIAAAAAVALSRILWLRSAAGAMLIGVIVALPVRHRAEASCTARLDPGTLRLAVRVIDPGAGEGRVRPELSDCRGTIRALWPAGRTVPAGVDITVVGRWRPRVRALGRPDGMLYIDQVGRGHGHPDLIARSRNAVADRSELLFGSRAAVVDALIAGRQGGLPDELVENFARSGLIHLLVISGSHIGLVAGWVTLLVALVGLPPRWGLRAGAVVATGYAAWLGWPAPATRAAALIVTMAVGRAIQRRWRPAGGLGCSAIVVLLIDPWAMSRIGAWLSFVAIVGVMVASRWAEQAWSGRSELRQTLAASIGATLTTAPLAAWSFGRVAPIGVVLNLVAIPLAAVVVPAVAGALLLEPLLPEMARALAASGSVLVDALIALGNWGAGLPGAAHQGDGGVMAAVPWLVALAAGWFTVRDRPTPAEAGRRLWWCGASAALITLVRPARQPQVPADQLWLTFLDVGQGDAAAIRTPGGHWLLIDTGPADARYDAGRRVVAPFLKRTGVSRLTAMVLSHAHRDHIGGATAVAEAVPTALIVEPGEPVADSAYWAVLRMADADGSRWHVAAAGDSFAIDGVSFRVLHPPRHWSRRGQDLNEDSLVLELRWRDFSALLAGDAGIVAESSYVARAGPIDLLKVGHHGSRTATGTLLLRRRPPQAAIISLGVNRYGHPAPETLARLAAARVAVWRTDQQGPVTVTTDGHTFTVQGERSTRTFDATDP